MKIENKLARLNLDICIVSHNSCADLAKCLTRLHEVLPVELSTQVIVVDNTGKDGSAEYIRREWPSVHLIVNPEPQGFSANVNAAAAAGQAQYILVMNPDVLLWPGAIETMIAYLEAHPDVGACGPKTLYPDGTLQMTCRRFPSWATVFWRWLKLDRVAQPEFYRRFLMLDCNHEEAQAVDWIMGSCMMIRRKVFAEVGGFDEGFFLYYEDIDFCRRLWQSGYGVHYVPAAVVTHTYRRQSAQSCLNPLTLVHLKSILRYRNKHGLSLVQIPGQRFAPGVVLLLMLGDIFVTELALQLGRYARLWFPILGAFPYPNPSPLNKSIYAIVPVIWVITFSLLGLYHPDRIRRASQETGRLLFGVILSGLALAGCIYALFLYKVYIPRLLLVYFLGFNIILLIVERAVLQYTLSRSGITYRPRVLLVGLGEIGQNIIRWLSQDQQAQVDLIATLPWSEEPWDGERTPTTPTLASRIAMLVDQLRIDEVILTPPLPYRDVIAQIVKTLQRYPTDIKIVPDFLDLALYRARVEEFYGVLAISLRSPAIHGSRRIVKRLFDLAIAIPGLIIALPIMLLAAIAIRIDSPGPVIFRQQRVGENGRLFTIYKLRTMVDGAERYLPQVITTDEQGNLVYKKAQDFRVTRVGRFLRRWSIDELPQLWNVVKGEMSLVGPRPELPFLVSRYENWQYKRLTVPPGLTGWWQVRSRGQKPMHLATEEDLFYIEHYSIWLDLQILIRTVGAIISGKGAF